MSSGVKYHIDCYKDDSKSVNIVKDNGNNNDVDINKDDDNENENDNKMRKRYFIGVSGGVCTATPGSQSKSWTTPVLDNNKKPTSHINKKPSFGRKGFCPCIHKL